MNMKKGFYFVYPESDHATFVVANTSNVEEVLDVVMADEYPVLDNRCLVYDEVREDLKKHYVLATIADDPAFGPNYLLVSYMGSMQLKTYIPKKDIDLKVNILELDDALEYSA